MFQPLRGGGEAVARSSEVLWETVLSRPFFWFIFVACLIMLFPPSGIMFEGGERDGFFRQLAGVDDPSRSLHLLYPLHLVRYLAVFPAWMSHKLDMPATAWSGILVLYALPLFLMKMHRLQKAAALLIFLMAYFVSLRTCLVTISMAILYASVFHENKSRLLLVYSALLANLSSGVVLAWLAVAVIYRKHFRGVDAFILALIALLFLGFAFSLADKVDYFLNLSGTVVKSEQAVPLSESALSIIGVVLTRSTLVLSYMEGQFFRFAVYGLALVYMAACTMYSFVYKKPQTAFFLVGLGGFLFEGLGPASFFLCALLFGVGEGVEWFSTSGAREAPGKSRVAG